MIPSIVFTKFSTLAGSRNSSEQHGVPVLVFELMNKDVHLCLLFSKLCAIAIHFSSLAYEVYFHRDKLLNFIEFIFSFYIILSHSMLYDHNLLFLPLSHSHNPHLPKIYCLSVSFQKKNGLPGISVDQGIAKVE